MTVFFFFSILSPHSFATSPTRGEINCPLGLLSQQQLRGYLVLGDRSISQRVEDVSIASRTLVLCRPGSACKPRLWLGFRQLRLLKIEAWAVNVAWGQLGLGLGLGRSLGDSSWNKKHVFIYFAHKAYIEKEDKKGGGISSPRPRRKLWGCRDSPPAAHTPNDNQPAFNLTKPISHHPYPKRPKRGRFTPPTPNDLNGLVSLGLQQCISGRLHLLTLSIMCSRFEVVVVDPDIRGSLLVDTAAGIVSVVSFCGRWQFPSWELVVSSSLVFLSWS